MKKLFLLLFITLLLGSFTANVYADPPQVQKPLLEWDVNEDADGYVIGVIDRVAFPDDTWPNSYRTVPIEGKRVMVMDVGNVTQVSFSDILINEEPLKEDNAYEFKVIAYNDYGNTSDWSDKVDHTILSTVSQTTLSPVTLRKTVQSVPTIVIININGEIITLTTQTGGE